MSRHETEVIMCSRGQRLPTPGDLEQVQAFGTFLEERAKHKGEPINMPSAENADVRDFVGGQDWPADTPTPRTWEELTASDQPRIPATRQTISFHGSLVKRAIANVRELGDSESPESAAVPDGFNPRMLDDASVVTSLGKSGDLHYPVLDLDINAMLWPSTTPGHFHLLLDVEVQPEKYFAMLDALAAAGVIEPGYAEASRARGYSSVRLPWIRKDDNHDE